LTYVYLTAEQRESALENCYSAGEGDRQRLSRTAEVQTR